MDSLPSFGTAIQDVLVPTIKTFAPELVRNKESILSIPRTTYSYGTHPRQQLDVYSSPDSPETSPILVFLYGGGLIHGDKIIAPVPEGLVYHNLGTFFARQGYTTIIVDYRRVNNPETGTGEDAVFPSGGQDVGAALQWLEGFLEKSKSGQREVFLMGNSAGGVHVSTYLLAPQFAEQRRGILGGTGKVLLKGGVLLSVPLHFEQMLEARASTLNTYFGPQEETERKCPYGLLKSFDGETPRLLVLVAELDPEDEIVSTNRDFYKLAKEKLGAENVDWIDMESHNHISPPVALCTGDARGEKWGHDIVTWMKRSVKILNV